MLSFLLSLSLFTLKGEIGYTSNLPVVDGQSHADFISKSSINVVFYTEPRANLEFADYATEKYGKEVMFAKAPINNVDSNSCDGFPCVMAYRGGQRIGKNSPLVPSGFNQWILDLIKPQTIKIKHPEELRILLNKCGSFVLGIGTEERPKGMKDSETFYVVPSQFLVFFDISVSKGIYVYRSADRMLVKANNNNYRNYLNTPIADQHSTNLSAKRYIGGYFLEPNNKESNEKQMKLLREIAIKFPEINFLPIAGGMYAICNEIGKVEHLITPLFVVLPSGNETGRWVIQGEQAENIEYITDVISGVLNGSLPSLEVSAPVDPSDKYQVTYDTYPEILANQEKHDIIIAYVSNFMVHGDWFASLMPACAELINDSNVQFYVYNLSTNDPPSDLGSISDVVIRLYPKSASDEPVMYTGNPNIKHFIDWVCESTVAKPKMPHYSPMHYMNDVLPPLETGGMRIKYGDEIWGIPGETPDPTKEDSPFEL